MTLPSLIWLSLTAGCRLSQQAERTKKCLPLYLLSVIPQGILLSFCSAKTSFSSLSRFQLEQELSISRRLLTKAYTATMQAIHCFQRANISFHGVIKTAEAFTLSVCVQAVQLCRQLPKKAELSQTA